MWPRPAIDQAGILYDSTDDDDDDDETIMMMMIRTMIMMNIHDNRGSQGAKDAKSNRKPACSYDLSSEREKKAERD